MAMGWEKLFKNNPTPANNLRALAIRYEPGEDAPSANSGPVITSSGRAGVRRSGPKWGSEVAEGRAHFRLDWPAQRRPAHSSRRHRALIPQYRGHPFSVLRSLGPIDQTLIEIERTKVAHLETERKFEGLSEAHERLRTDHAVLTLDRNALGVRHQEASERRQGSSRKRLPPPRRAPRRLALRSRSGRRNWSAPSGNSRTISGACIR